MTDHPDIVDCLYDERDHEAQGDFYLRHIAAMTYEGLHAKSAIAAELAHRDIEITRLRAEAEALRKDAERYRWLHSEHERVDPICHLVWKLNGDRSSSEWVNTARLDVSIDLAIAATKEQQA